MQSRHQLSNNQSSIVGLSSSRPFLRPHQLNPNLTLVAWTKRGPHRYLGWTRTQVLDSLMRSNARICATICMCFFPVVGAWVYRYHTVLKPAKLEFEQKRQEELLAEGKFEKS